VVALKKISCSLRRKESLSVCISDRCNRVVLYARPVLDLLYFGMKKYGSYKHHLKNKTTPLSKIKKSRLRN